ncbi:MAG: DEAD/DEAH box helicase [Acidobacteria bacterium]|nr:DEAD/DEAH box helicase [Acidobacteriota bacterium]
MIILHAAFCRNSLLVRSEPEGGRKALLSAIAGLGARFKYPARAVRKAVAWLPAREGRPVPSSALLDHEPVPDHECYLAPWVVTVLPLDPLQTMDLVSACLGKRMVAPGILIGDDLSYWTAALRFAAGLVMRGQFLPALAVENGGYRARWNPVFAGTDAARLHALAKAMPPAARALTFETEDKAPDTASEAVLTGFCRFLVDSLVRSSSAPEKPCAVESIHDRWLAALAAGDGEIRGSPGELKTLADQVEQWQRAVQVSARAPFRLCFRLLEPEQDGELWDVHYLLQSTKDPSLLLPAVHVWNPRRGIEAALGQDNSAMREQLLVSLGQAASICGRVEASLKERAPNGYRTDSNGAYEFLRETAAALEQSGFGVMLPAWWTRRGAQVRLKARARVKSGPIAGAAGLSLDTLINFDWELALGEDKMSRAELQALARLKTPLVKVRGQWVEVNAAAIQAALDFLKKNASGQAAVRDLVRMAIGAAGEAGPLEVDGVTATGWVGDLLAKLEGRAAFEELLQPRELNGTLRPYQQRGYSWLEFLKRLGLGACLADDMGLGKTIQTLALIQRDRAAGEQRPVLLVCPTSVVGNWQKEAARFTPELPVLAHHGVQRRRGAAFSAEAASYAIVISSYALLHRDIDILRDVSWAGVVLDEAQNIKNPETKQARAARSLGCGYRIALTGTPVENNVGDLWSLLEFLNPGFLGSRNGFHKNFFVPIQVYSDQQAAERLRRITGPFILRRLKTDKSIIADLPEKLEMKVFCNLTKEQASLYEAVVKDAQEAIESAEGIERKGLVLATLMKLKQVCNHPAQFLKDNSAIPGRSGKLARAAEMLEETLAVGDRSLIFTQFAEMGEILHRHFQEIFGVEALYLHGATSRKQRDRMVDRFAQKDGPSIFLLSLKAGGTGLNLTSANHVFHFDRWWNPAVENQATDRAFRIGQTRNVQVHKFVCAGTLEERIDEMIERKKSVAGRVVGAGEAWLSELSNAELRSLFALRKDAVGE